MSPAVSLTSYYKMHNFFQVLYSDPRKYSCACLLCVGEYAIVFCRQNCQFFFDNFTSYFAKRNDWQDTLWLIITDLANMVWINKKSHSDQTFSLFLRINMHEFYSFCNYFTCSFRFKLSSWRHNYVFITELWCYWSKVITIIR